MHDINYHWLSLNESEKHSNLDVLGGFQVDKFHLFWADEILDCPKLS